MQPLGLSRLELDAYHQELGSSHKPEFSYDLLTLEGRPVASLPAPDDGIVNANRADAVTRILTATLFDPDRQAQLDAYSPSAGTMHLDRLIRVQHTIWVPELDRDVTATPFYGWLTKADRDGQTIRLEGQGLERRAQFGCPPLTIRAGTRVVDAIKIIMRRRTGERRFRFPAHHKARLTKNVSVGWGEKVTPWRICRRLARSIDMQLIYSCDGWCTLRRHPDPDRPRFAVTWPGNITSEPQSTGDALAAHNYVAINGKKKVEGHAKARAGHTLSPESLARHDVPLYLPLVVEDDDYRTRRQARRGSRRLLREHLKVDTETTVTLAPAFHLDLGDVLDLDTPYQSGRLRLKSFQLPLNGADMTINRRQQLKPREGRIRA